MSDTKDMAYWEQEMKKCKKDPVYFYENYLVIKQLDGTTRKPTPLRSDQKIDMKLYATKVREFETALDEEIKEVENAYHKYEFGELRLLLSIQMGYDPDTATEEEKLKAEPTEKRIETVMKYMKELSEYGKQLKSVKTTQKELLSKNQEPLDE